MVAVGIISRRLGDKLKTAGKLSKLAQVCGSPCKTIWLTINLYFKESEDALDRENEVEIAEDTGRKIATRRYQLMKDPTGTGVEDGFMSRLDIKQ